MSLKSQLTEDMKQAMRDRDSVRLGTIRFLLADIKNFEIDNGEQDDAGVQKLISKQLKQMKDAMADFAKGDRQDLIAEEQAKVAVLEAYLPSQMSDEELQRVVQEVVTQTEPKAMGPIMQAVMAKVGGQADGGRVSAMVKQALTT